MQKNISPNPKILQLQNELGYHFKNLQLLELALTHSSFAHAQGKAWLNNERLEFLGDAALELCVSDMLYRNFPNATEGQLTSMRARLVNGRALGEIAEKLNLPELARKSIGEEWQGEKQRQSLGADALEAIIAAVFLDGGFKAAWQLSARLFKKCDATAGKQDKNPKNALQEKTMSLFRALPKYETLSENGPEHAKIFHVQVNLPNGKKFTGNGTNRKKAEQEAARNALEFLKREYADNEN